MSKRRIESAQTGKRTAEMRDTFGFRPYISPEHTHTGEDEATDTSSDTSSDHFSTIPDLSLAEENAMRRSFRAIQTGPTEDNPGRSSLIRHIITEDDETGDVSKPIAELGHINSMMTESNRTVDWLDAGAKGFHNNTTAQPMGRLGETRVTPDTGREHVFNDSVLKASSSYDTSIHQMRTDTRDGTPDSTASTGQMMILNKEGIRKAINPTNINDNVGKSMRTRIQGYQHSADVEPESPRPSTSNHVDRRLPANTANVGKSMRIQLQEYQNNADAETESPLPSTSNHVDRRLPPYTVDEVENGDVTESNQARQHADSTKKQIRLLPRRLLITVSLVVLLAGIVALIAVLKTDEHADAGVVLPNQAVGREYSDIYLSFGDQIVIHYIQDTDHDSLEDMNGIIILDSPNQVSRPDFNATLNGTQWKITGPRVTCNSAGTYTIGFIDKKKRVILKTTVMLHLNASSLETNVTQSQADDEGHTQFHVECSILNVCENFDMNFMGMTNLDTYNNLNQYKICKANFSDANGYSMHCKGSIPAGDVYQYSNGGNLSCQLAIDGKKESVMEFTIPECRTATDCSNLPPNDLDCSEGDSPTNATCESFQQCFGQDEFYRHCSESTVCSKACLQKWCRNSNNVIMRYPEFCTVRNTTTTVDF